MSGATYFIQSCPTCGRRLQIRVEHIGRDVSCYHCSARFSADSTPPHLAAPCAPDLMTRADHLLKNFGSPGIFEQTLTTQ